MKTKTVKVPTLDDETIKLISQRCDHGFFFLSCKVCERIDQCDESGTVPDWFFIPAIRSRHALN